jgi:hypothetical protein
MLAFTPVHFMRGRMLLSPLYTVPFILAWLWALARFDQRPSSRSLMAACVLLAGGMYSYLGAVLMMPIYMLMTIGVAARSLRPRPIVLAVVAAGACLLPMAAWYLVNPERNAHIVSDYQLTTDRSPAAVIGHRLDLYWQFFDPSYLFISGDGSMINSTRTSGLLPWAFAVLLPIGFAAMVRSRQRMALVIAVGLLTAPFAAVVSGALEMNRVMFVIPSAVLAASYGVVELWRGNSAARAIATVLVASVALQFAGFYRHYMSDAYRVGASSWFSGNAREALRELITRSADGPVYISRDMEWIEGLWQFYAIEANRPELIDRAIYFTDPPLTVDGPATLICAADSAPCAALAASGSWSDIVRVPTLDGGRTFVIFERTPNNQAH